MPLSLSPEPRSLSPRGTGHIIFDHVWFAYNGSDYVLKDVSFEVHPGERVAVVGATGAGKSTIINLLLRFYDVTRGRILIDGVDIRELPLDALRRLFSLVLQDVYLFSGTIAENIRLGNVGITDADVRRAAATVHADRFIEPMPLGYDSPVAERGATLSVGQKQLLSFARALAFDPKVLVLDEATSSVDTETEVLIRDALHLLMAGRTTIAIAHRLSTIQDMDKILVLHRGELRESGSHQELLAARGLYFKLYQLQYKDQESRPEILETVEVPSGVARLLRVLISRWRRRSRSRRRSRRDLRLFPLPEEAIDEPRAARAGVPAHTQDDDLHRPPAQCERFVAAPHVDVDVAALDLGAGIHDRVDTVVLLAEPVDLDDRADRQDVRVGGGNAGPDVHPGGGRRALAVGGRRKPQLGAGSRSGRRLADLGLPGRVAGIQRGHLI